MSLLLAPAVTEGATEGVRPVYLISPITFEEITYDDNTWYVGHLPVDNAQVKILFILIQDAKCRKRLIDVTPLGRWAFKLSVNFSFP